jgi:hypothetical protein
LQNLKCKKQKLRIWGRGWDAYGWMCETWNKVVSRIRCKIKGKQEKRA